MIRAAFIFLTHLRQAAVIVNTSATLHDPHPYVATARLIRLLLATQARNTGIRLCGMSRKMRS